MRNLALLVLATTLALLVMGYHPGLEDDAFYLAAIKRDLNPALFPHDADFFRLQFQATIFDKAIAASVRLSHLPLGVVIFAWQFVTILLILSGCLAIARRCFPSRPAQWTAVGLVAVLLTIPVAGTGISLVDQYLHPRAMATAAVLGAIVAILKEQRLLAGILLALAFVIHAIMASFGISFCIFLAWTNSPWTPLEERSSSLPRSPYSFFRWGGFLSQPRMPGGKPPPLGTFTFSAAGTGMNGWESSLLSCCSLCLPKSLGGTSLQSWRGFRRVFCTSESSRWWWRLSSCCHLLFERLRPFEPMRYLQLIYLLMFLVAGGLIGEYVLGKRVYRWLLLFVPLGLGMFYVQRQMYPSTAHLELPGMPPSNNWVAAFDWVKGNTPTGSLFALDPYYMELPGEDYHGFRALAERSALADIVKDAGMAARVPRLAPRWLREVDATRGWRNFRATDFQSLKNSFGVDWIVLAQPGLTGLNCPFQNRRVMVCRLD